jgi:hypothetical protein
MTDVSAETPSFYEGNILFLNASEAQHKTQLNGVTGRIPCRTEKRCEGRQRGTTAVGGGLECYRGWKCFSHRQ